jgi:2-succinyl-6-hydroxy-2,4-cyclohexadiene-1-carboxylate synthase
MSTGALYGETRGEAGAPAVLLLHGFLGSSADWSEVATRLEGEFYCLCPDLPGHGRSAGLPGSYSMERTSRLLADLLDRNGVSRTHVVGYSMGGRLALFFALAHPERCRRLILESASPGLPTEEERTARRELDEARAAEIETGDFLAFLKAWYRQPLFETYRRHEGLLEQMIEERSDNSPREVARSLREMGTGSQPSLWDRLEDLRMPVLAVAGAHDGKFVEIAERMVLRMPRARTAVVPGAGHTLHAEKPEPFVNIVIDFLKETFLTPYGRSRVE